MSHINPSHNLPLHDEDMKFIFAKFFELASEPMVITNQIGKIVSINPALSYILGYKLENIKGNNISFLFSEDEKGEVYNKFMNDLIKEGYWHNTIDSRSMDGQHINFDTRFSKIESKLGHTAYYVGIMTPTKNHNTHKGEQFNQLKDSLTDSLNLPAFSSTINRLIRIAQFEKKFFSVMFINIDNFKQINDDFGHIVGDSVLRNMALTIQKNIGVKDFVSRIKDDIFAVGILDENQDDLEKSVSKIFHALKEPQVFNKKIPDLGFSAGIASYPTAGTDFKNLSEKALICMRQARENGGNQFIYDLYMNK